MIIYRGPFPRFCPLYGTLPHVVKLLKIPMVIYLLHVNLGKSCPRGGIWLCQKFSSKVSEIDEVAKNKCPRLSICNGARGGDGRSTKDGYMSNYTKYNI